MSTPTTADRRRDAERRAGAERRRGGDERHVTIEVCESEIHVAVVVRSSPDKRPLLITRSSDWRKDSASLLTAKGAEELAAAFKQLAAEERVAGCEANVQLGPGLCVTRTATANANEINRLASELEERGRLYLALGAGEVCVAKSSHAVDARHRHALASMANQRVIDAVAHAAHQAGLNLRRVESSMVGLCRTHAHLHPGDEAPVLLILAQRNRLLLGVAQRGRLLLEYAPGGAADPRDARKILDKHFGRFTQQGARAQLGMKLEIKKAYVGGPAEPARAALAALAGFPSLSVQPLLTAASDAWDTRGQGVLPESASTLGGALLKLYPDRHEDGPNLLENWIRESRKHLRPVLLRSAAPIAATLLVALTILAVNASMSVRNGGLLDELAAAEPLKARYGQLRLDLTSSEAKIRSLERLATGIPTTSLPEAVRRVAQCLPPDVWLDRFVVSDQTDATLAGSGFTESGVYEFVGHMEALPGAVNAALQDTGVRQSAQGPVTSFNMTMALDAGLGHEGHADHAENAHE